MNTLVIRSIILLIVCVLHQVSAEPLKVGEPVSEIQETPDDIVEQEPETSDEGLQEQPDSGVGLDETDEQPEGFDIRDAGEPAEHDEPAFEIDSHPDVGADETGEQQEGFDIRDAGEPTKQDEPGFEISPDSRTRYGKGNLVLPQIPIPVSDKPAGYVVDTVVDGVHMRLPYLFEGQPPLKEEAAEKMIESLKDYIDFFGRVLDKRLSSKKNAVSRFFSWFSVSMEANKMFKKHRKAERGMTKPNYREAFMDKHLDMFSRMLKDSHAKADELKKDKNYKKDPDALRQDIAKTMNALKGSLDGLTVGLYVDWENIMFDNVKLYDRAVELMTGVRMNGLNGLLSVIETILGWLR